MAHPHRRDASIEKEEIYGRKRAGPYAISEGKRDTATIADTNAASDAGGR